MPLKSKLLFFLYAAIGTVMTPCAAQEFQNGANLSKHTIGYAMGYTYPKFADGSDDVMIAWDFNYGFSGAFEWGKYYTSGISFMITPIVHYSNYMNSVKTRDQYQGISDKLTFREEWTTSFSELAISLPLSYEFPMFKTFRFGGSASISLPLSTGGNAKKVDYDYYLYTPGLGGHYIDPPKKKEYVYDIEYHLTPSLGVGGKLLYPITGRENVESYLALDYFYDLAMADPPYVHKTRITLSYVHRNIKYKDVREKWDRYLIRKNKY